MTPGSIVTRLHPRKLNRNKQCNDVISLAYILTSAVGGKKKTVRGHYTPAAFRNEYLSLLPCSDWDKLEPLLDTEFPPLFPGMKIILESTQFTVRKCNYWAMGYLSGVLWTWAVFITLWFFVPIRDSVSWSKTNYFYIISMNHTLFSGCHDVLCKNTLKLTHWDGRGYIWQRFSFKSRFMH